MRSIALALVQRAVEDKRVRCLAQILGWSAQPASGLSPAMALSLCFRAQAANERVLVLFEWKAHEAVRVRLRGGLALVRGCLEPRKRWGMCLSLRALEAGTGTAYVVQQRCRARGLHSHPGAAACTSQAQAASRPRALTALIVKHTHILAFC